MENQDPVETFFRGENLARQIFAALQAAIAQIGGATVQVSKSQVAFKRRRAFAWAWIPGKYLRGKTAPLVLTLALGRRDPSPRWKEIVEPAPGRFTHHLELYAPTDIDQEVRGWLIEAWEDAV